ERLRKCLKAVLSPEKAGRDSGLRTQDFYNRAFMSRKPSLFIIDGSNNVYRSYFAIRGLTNSSGLATNAVYGFTQTLKKLLNDHKPDNVAVAFDIGSSKTRHEAFADYKKDRRPMPDDLAIQLPFVNEVLEGFRIPVIGVEDW